ncbi:MAG: hypothetical protein KDI09_01640, partial [Halioglobus sp.]|nr:hypothetical protein [Halioglobus sp.]
MATTPQRHHDSGGVIVGVGASAGGLAAYKQLLDSLPPDTGLTFVLIQHLDPAHESLMAELLAKHSAMPVVQVQTGMPIQANHIYIIPPNTFLRVEDNLLILDDPVSVRGIRLPIDYFFRSLAAARTHRAVGVVLSGTGSDGAVGVREIKSQGGLTIAQNPDTAEHTGMPSAAINTGAVDYVLDIAQIADQILAYASHSYVQSTEKSTLAESAPDDFRLILAKLRAQTHQDFSDYKPGTLTRRIQRRMSIRHITTTPDYIRLLDEDPDEVQQLFRDVLIGVTSFFRDRSAWEELHAVITSAVTRKGKDDPFRVWVPGCSTGEEAYAIAMTLFDIQATQKHPVDFQIFASDLNQDAVEVARLGLYPENVSADIPAKYLKKCFHRESGKLRVDKKLRESCIFAVQNILSDPPFSNLDLISCRNLLIYLGQHLQQKLIPLFHFALKPNGYLLLGPSENLSSHSEIFRAIDKKHRISQRKPGPVRS